ncbi:MAG: ABC transporter permease [Clostridia bacterium]|nr:ABC transporter permease [Clostridia bacterium]
MLAVLKKELKSYFLTPVGYIFIGLFLLILSVFFHTTIFSYRSPNFEFLFYNGATILTFLTPILTMRMFSEERKNGTEQLLLTSPRGITSIVLGKFFAGVIMLIITELFTFIYFAILKYFTSPSIVLAATTLFGFLLLGICYVSFGMFISSLTESQVISAVVTIGVFLLIWFFPTRDQILSLIDKFQMFPEGLIQLSDIITYASFTLMFILLTIITLQRRKSVK